MREIRDLVMAVVLGLLALMPFVKSEPVSDTGGCEAGAQQCPGENTHGFMDPNG